MNENGDSFDPSEPITLTPSALPDGSMSIVVDEYSGNYLLLSWNEPVDTGAVGIPILSYQLEVDEGFGSGFVPITGQEQSTPTF